MDSNYTMVLHHVKLIYCLWNTWFINCRK